MRKLMVGLLCMAVVGGATAEELDLSGMWRLEGTDERGEALSCPIAVPGGVHSALFKAGRIPDPYWGRNELKTQWVGRQDWKVSRTFTVDAKTCARKAIVLRLDNVDTFATVFLNGRELGKTDNRFRRWEFDVKPYLKEGENELVGVFASAEMRAHELAKTYEHEYRISCVPWATDQALIRKPACHAGWDWGLAQMITGFCGETTLLAYDDCKVDYVYTHQAFNADMTRCDLTVVADATDADGRAFAVTNRLSIDNPPLWWPNGAGERRFYEFDVRVGSHTVHKRIGLRKVEVLNTPDVDENGKAGARLAFRVNGREIFMKGANWIPCSAFENEQTPERYRDLLESAAAANMNMIRIWGGGQYEKDCFYDICDELGILLWHDLMFSCANYPGDERFLSSIRAEFEHQVRRLRDHASIAMWCGDNECIGALNWFRAKEHPEHFRDTLERRHAVSAEVIGRFDPDRMFWPSSPCAGPGDYADNWKSDASGDMHNWMVWHANKSFDNYYDYRPRFCSEFGYQSFPSRDVAATFCQEINPTSPDFEWHQKNRGGNPRMLETMSRYFRFPQGSDAILYLSQVQQAIAIKTAVEGWRAQRPRCMGTLYWQLNDDWPVASWSSLEYGGKWKHLHHQARRFYAPLAVVGVPALRRDQVRVEIPGDGDPVVVGSICEAANVKILNDLAESVAAEVVVEFRAFDGRVLKRLATDVRLPPDSVTDWGGGTLRKDDVGEPSFLVLRLKTRQGEFRNDWMFGYYKEYDLARAKVMARFDGLDVTLSTDRPAFFVWANVRGVRGEFSDNSLTLLPDRPVTLTFKAKEPVGPEAFRRAFEVTHLRETY